MLRKQQYNFNMGKMISALSISNNASLLRNASRLSTHFLHKFSLSEIIDSITPCFLSMSFHLEGQSLNDSFASETSVYYESNLESFRLL